MRWGYYCLLIQMKKLSVKKVTGLLSFAQLEEEELILRILSFRLKSIALSSNHSCLMIRKQMRILKISTSPKKCTYASCCPAVGEVHVCRTPTSFRRVSVPQVPCLLGLLLVIDNMLSHIPRLHVGY